MRTGRLAFVLALALSLTAGMHHRAWAEGGEGGTTVEGGSGEHGGEGEGEKPEFVKNSPTHVWTKSVEHPIHERPISEGQWYGSTKKNGGPFRDPIIGKNKSGRYVIKEDPNVERGNLKPYANKEQVKTWGEHQENFEQPKGVTLISTQGKGAAGLNAGPFKDGRANLAEGSLGEVNLDVLRADGEYSAGIGVGNGNVQAQAGGRGFLTLVGVQAESKVGVLGDPNGLNNAMGQVEGRAFIGADAEGAASLHVGTHGVGGQAEVGAFAGGKAEVMGAGTVTICGVQVNLTGTAEASYGIGAKATGAFSIDWSTMTVKIGAKASLTVGGGLGAGGTIEVSLAKVLNDPAKAAECVAEHLGEAAKYVAEKGVELAEAAGDLAMTGVHKLADAADAVGSALGSAASSVGSWVGGLFGGGDDDSASSAPTAPIAVASFGVQPARTAVTVPVAAAGTPGGTANGGQSHQGAGFAH